MIDFSFGHLDEKIILTLPKIDFSGRLKIVDCTKGSFEAQVGISSERSHKLADMIMNLAHKYQDSNIPTCNLIDEIASFCVNLEEYSFALIFTSHWLILRGQVL